MSEKEETTRRARNTTSIRIRAGIRDGVVKDSNAVLAKLEQLRDHFQVSSSKYDDGRRAAKHRCNQLFKKCPLAAIIFGVIVVMEMQNVPQSECPADGQKDYLPNGAPAPCNVDMCHAGRRKTRASQRKDGAAKINSGTDDMPR